MNIKLIIYRLGKIMAVASALFLVPAAVSLIYDDNCFLYFLAPAGVMFLIGLAFTFLKPEKRTSHAREGFVIVSLLWIVLSVFGAAPFVISGYIPSPVDALFEAVSGFTTTGSSILTDVEALPMSLLFWRSFTHWVGGMGVLALVIAVLPNERMTQTGRSSDTYILKAETPGPTFGKLVSKLRHNVRILYGIYAAMTLIQIILLLLGGMPLFDSILNTFGTAGTGGFAIKNAGMAYYDSVYLEMVIAVFMVLFGINFNIYYFILLGKISKAFKSEELRWYLSIIAFSTVSIAVNLIRTGEAAARAFRYSFFQVASIITTTGYSSTNFDLWPTFSKIILVILMFCGACASSTGGGIKVSRIIIMVKTAIKEVRYMINPREVRAVKCDGAYVEQSTLIAVSSYLIVYMIILVISVIIVSLDGFDMTTTATSVISCLNNIGPGLEKVGALGNFSEFSLLSKCVLSFNMLAGRLEIFPLLILFSPSLWRK